MLEDSPFFLGPENKRLSRIGTLIVDNISNISIGYQQLMHMNQIGLDPNLFAINIIQLYAITTNDKGETKE